MKKKNIYIYIYSYSQHGWWRGRKREETENPGLHDEHYRVGLVTTHNYFTRWLHDKSFSIWVTAVFLVDTFTTTVDSQKYSNDDLTLPRY